LIRLILRRLDVKSGEMNTKSPFLTHKAGVLIIERNLEFFEIAGYGRVYFLILDANRNILWVRKIIKENTNV
jgi:hypothetical protein